MNEFISSLANQELRSEKEEREKKEKKQKKLKKLAKIFLFFKNYKIKNLEELSDEEKMREITAWCNGKYLDTCIDEYDPIYYEIFLKTKIMYEICMGIVLEVLGEHSMVRDYKIPSPLISDKEYPFGFCAKVRYG